MFLATAFVLSLCCWTSVYSFKYEDCGGEDAVIQFKRIKVTPEEPNIYENVFLDAKIKVKETVPRDTIVSVKVGKYPAAGFGGFNLASPVAVPVPCINKVGSCEYKLCEAFAHDEFCKYVKEVGGKCDCPVPADTYKTDKTKGVKLEKKHQTLGIEKGRYDVVAKFLSKGRQLGCLKADFTLK